MRSEIRCLVAVFLQSSSHAVVLQNRNPFQRLVSENHRIRHRSAVYATVSMRTTRVTITETQRLIHQFIKKRGKVTGISAMCSLIVAHTFHNHHNDVVIV